MNRLGKTIFLFALMLVVLVNNFGLAADSKKRIVVLDFLAIDEHGNYIDPLGIKQAELINLSRVMAQSIVARLVQYGKFDVENSISLKDELQNLAFTYQTSAWERAASVLENDLADQVIIGSITLLQNTAVVGVQRFTLQEGKTNLTGSAVGSAPRISEAPAQVDNILQQLFPKDIQVVERSIEQVFAVPSQVRLNLGASHEITTYALDSLGRPIAEPQFLFFSSDESKVEVNEDGVVTGLQPGVATVTVRAVSQAKSSSPATMNVIVVPPAFGVRIGTLVTRPSTVDGYPLRLGIRLTPTIDQRGTQEKAPAAATQTVSDSSNPLSVLSSYFGSLLTNGLMTIDLDFDPTKELLVAFSGVQRSASGYIGTGVGYLTPLDDIEAQKGFVFRFTLGTQYRTRGRITVPIEAVMDAIFPTSTSFSPSFRIGINVGLDLFP